MQAAPPLSPLAAAVDAIEAATASAIRRAGQEPSAARRWRVLTWLHATAAGRDTSDAPTDRAEWAELVRWAGLQAVHAAVVDDDMRALRLELEVALQALAAA